MCLFVTVTLTEKLTEHGRFGGSVCGPLQLFLALLPKYGLSDKLNLTSMLCSDNSLQEVCSTGNARVGSTSEDAQ